MPHHGHKAEKGPSASLAMETAEEIDSSLLEEPATIADALAADSAWGGGGAGAAKPSEEHAAGVGNEPLRPAREHKSSFGNDMDLSEGLPQNWTLAKFQTQVKASIQEYFLSMDVDGAAAGAREILRDCPSFDDEYVVLLLRASLEQGEDAQGATVKLLTTLCGTEVLDRAALVRGFEKMLCTWEDVAIDAPRTPEGLLTTLHSCHQAKIIDRSLLTKIPENLLNAGVEKVTPEVSEMLKGIQSELKKFKQMVAKDLDAYFLSLNADGVEAGLRELDMRAYHYEFVKKAMTLSFSQQNVDQGREVALALMTQLSTANLLTKDDLQWGVTRVLGLLDDLALDCPKVTDYAISFLSWMVADELLSVPFLRRCRLLRIGGASGLKVMDATQRKTPEYSKRHLGTSQFKSEIHIIILEYFSSGDETEVGRCVRELAPLSEAQSAELVRKTMGLAMERTAAECELALRVLIWLSRQEELDDGAIERGFDDMYQRMGDISLDVPDARKMARSFVVEAKKAEILRDEWQEPQDA